MTLAEVLGKAVWSAEQTAVAMVSAIHQALQKSLGSSLTNRFVKVACGCGLDPVGVRRMFLPTSRTGIA